MSLYNEQKITKPQIEDIVPEVLSGDKMKLALDFIAYLRLNNLPPIWASANSWKTSYKNKGVCYVRLREGYLSVSPYVDYTKEFEEFAAKENIRDIILNNLAFCRRCHPHTCAPKCGKSEDEFFGVKKTFLGKEFDNICRGGGDAHFHDPDEAEIDCIKKLIEFKRQTIDGMR